MPEYQISFKLPLSGKTVVITQPEWGIQREIARLTKDAKLSPQDQTAALLSKITTVDGEPIGNYMDFDKWAERDYVCLVEKYNEWPEEDRVKNELPTQK